ncbi:MAG: hypothetical protein IID31_00025 [Planctomycetes bacterium]|nr:hypothetical protein [Planctomycetota bacterium]
MTSFRHCFGFTLVEAAISTIIVGGVLVASLNVIGAAAMTRHRLAQRQRARLLASDLMSEILSLPYADPTLGAGVNLGPEPGEVSGTRALFDDVDDYHGWSVSPPQSKDGAPLNGFAGWNRSVTCRHVAMDTLDEMIGDTGVIEITVSVRRKGTTLDSIVALRTQTWDSP